MFGWKTFYHTKQEERHLPHEFWQGQFSTLFTKFLDSFLGLKKTHTISQWLSKAWVWIWLLKGIAYFDGKQTALIGVSTILGHKKVSILIHDKIKRQMTEKM